MRTSDIRFVICAVLALAMIAPILLAPVMQEQPHRLVGVGCGPEKLTLTAMEEDHFPQCERIEAND